MKKYVLSILSLILLISPVFADDVSSVPLRSFVSFESINSNYNLVYSFFPFFNGNDRTYGNDGFFRYPNYINPGFIDSSNSVNYNLSYFYSQSNQSGSIFNPLIGGALFLSGFDSNVLSLNNSYNPFIFVGGSNNIINPSRFAVYFQGANSGVVENSGNFLLRFGNNYNTGDSFMFGFNNSFFRLLYNSNNLWFKDSSYLLSGDNVSPYSIQIFPRDSQYFFTEKGRFSIQNTIPNKVISSVGNGFSFVNKLVSTDTYYLDDLDFYSVLPNWDSYFSNSSSSTRFIRSGYIDGLYIFKLDSFSKNTDFQDIGVLSKCNIDFCSGLNSVEDLLSSMVFSNYLCDFSSNFDLKNNCELVGGGILLNVLNTTGLEVPLNLNYNGFIFDLLTYSVSTNTQTFYNSNFLSLSLNNTPYSLSTHIVDVRPSGSYYHNWFQSNSYNITYTGGYSISNPPDIFGVVDFIIPEDSNKPLTTGSINTSIRDKCITNNTFFQLNTLLCNSLGVGVGDTISDSGQCYQRTVVYNVDGGISYKWFPCGYPGGDHIVVDNSGLVIINCTGFDCISNAVSNYYYNSGASIVSGSYYEGDNFFFSCPYPIYSGRFISKISNVVNLGDFDLSLPIQCYYSAFMNGKNKILFSGLVFDNIRILGSISGDSDERKYLFPFFDFILSLGLLIFLLKLYHLFK